VGTLEITRWRRERRAFGRIRCTPPDGDELAEIVIHEHVRPLMSLRALVDERRGVATAIEPATPLATVEGELGAVVHFEAAGVYHALGVVYGDDFQTIVDGRTTRADQCARLERVTRDIVVHLPLGLGQKRHRRFWYRPPAGWQGLVRGLVTDWFPLDHPRNPATIKVLPARPLDAEFHLDTLLRDDVFADVAIDDLEHVPLPTTAFAGVLVRATAGERAFLTAALEDRQYVYVLRLATTLGRLPEHELVFQDLVRSCVPLPQPASAALAAAQMLDYWT
jgi:hypothetical protein